MLDLDRMTEGYGRCPKRLTHQNGAGLAVVENVFQLWHGEPPVERVQNGAAFGAGKQGDVIIGAVVGQNGDAIARLQAKLVHEEMCQPVSPLIELGVGKLLPAVGIYNSYFVWRSFSMPLNPIKVNHDVP